MSTPPLRHIANYFEIFVFQSQRIVSTTLREERRCMATETIICTSCSEAFVPGICSSSRRASVVAPGARYASLPEDGGLNCLYWLERPKPHQSSGARPSYHTHSADPERWISIGASDATCAAERERVAEDKDLKGGEAEGGMMLL